MMETGIPDPSKVTRLALQSAASVAGRQLTAGVMVAEAPKEGHDHPPMPGGGMGGTDMSGRPALRFAGRAREATTGPFSCGPARVPDRRDAPTGPWLACRQRCRHSQCSIKLGAHTKGGARRRPDAPCMGVESSLRLTGHEQPAGGAVAADTASTSAVRIEIARSAGAARGHLQAWQGLADRAAEPNVFYEPWQLLPALETVCGPLSLRLLFVYRGERLVGFFPFSRRATYKGLPIRRHALIGHIHCFLCTPLVDAAADGERCCAAVARWMAAHRGPSLFEFRGISAGVARLLTRHLENASIAVAVPARHERAYFSPAQLSGQYFDGNRSHKALKDLRRRQRRLAECGALEYRELAPDADPSPWIDAFLALEQEGWKGRARTALGCSDEERRYFRNIADAAHALGRLDLSGLFIDGRAIALSCKFRAGDGAFAFKIAFDERFARHSPGMLLEMHCVDRARAGQNPRWIDSCAQPDHYMANRVWLDRREIVTLTAATGGYGRFVQQAAVRLKRALAALRRRAR